MKKLTIRDIADEAGCSYATVSRVLNNRNGVHPETYKRVMETIEKLDYHPNAFARGLATNTSHTIAIIVPDISNPYFADIIASVEAETHKNGYELITCTSGWNIETEKRRLTFLQENQQVDGIIIRPCAENDKVYDKITVPFVSLCQTDNSKYSYVDVDNHLASYDATKYLISRGYKRIAFLSGPKHSQTCKLRVEGYLDALSDCGIKADTSIIAYTKYSFSDGYDTMKELLSRTPLPDAVFCFNDIMAISAQRSAIEAGLSIPEDIGILGFDDIYLAGIPQINLTTVSQSRSEIGKLATGILMNAIQSQSPKITQKILLQPDIVVRGSTK